MRTKLKGEPKRGFARRQQVDLYRVSEAMNQLFKRDIEAGTVQVFTEGDQVILDGDNWALIVAQDGRVATNMPMNDANYYDDDTDAFLDNVLAHEVYESLALLDARLDGGLVKGLLDSGELWSTRLGERLQEIPLGR
jgi:hypothetical protein